MSNPGEVDKFASLIIPNCQPTASQEEKLQSCPLAPVSEVCSDGIVPSSSSSDDASEQATGIVMLTLPDSSEEYQTPPEYRSCSQNSSNDGQIPAIVDRKRESGDGEGVDGDRHGDNSGDGDEDRHGGVRDSDDIGDGDGEVMVADGRKTVDLGNEMDDLGFVESSSKVIEENDNPSVENNDYDTEPEPIEVECEVNETEVFKMEVIGSSSEIAHDVFVEMSEREQEATVSEMVVDADVNIRKRKLPFAIETKEKIDVQEDECCKHELFKDSLKRVLNFFVGEEKREVGDAGVDFLETAKNRGMTFPRPQWWPPEGSED